MNEPIEPGTKLLVPLQSILDFLKSEQVSYLKEAHDLDCLDENYKCSVGLLEICKIEISKLAELEKPCVWTYDDVHFKWDAGCGLAWYFMDGEYTPEGNGMKFCPACGHPLKQEPTEGNE